MVWNFMNNIKSIDDGQVIRYWHFKVDLIFWDHPSARSEMKHELRMKTDV
jgi:hypothetical protein